VGSGYHVGTRTPQGAVKLLIITLTINPAIDRTVSVDKLIFEDRTYILNRTESAGGRGINASRVIHGFGGATLALLTSGGEAGERMEKSLAGMNFPFEVVRVKRETRTNFTISDKQGLTIKLNEVGWPLDPKELKEIRHLVEARISRAHWLMICGSIPPAVPAHFYSEIIDLAKEHGVKALVDTDGDALVHSLEAKPAIITPNQHEAERLLGRALITRSHFLEAIDRLRKMGSELVILSLGSRGALGSSPDGIFEAVPPHIDAVSPIGAGDAMAAAFVWSMEKKKTFAQSLRWGVAAGTAKAKLPGLTFPTFDQTRAIYKLVEVRTIA
jgi:6-phosphofructokinase 2